MVILGGDFNVNKANTNEYNNMLATLQVRAPRYAGVWAICCGLPEFSETPIDLSNGAGRPALFQWGTRDPIVGPDRAEPVAKTLGDGGWALSEHAYDMAHSQTIEMMVDARAWLASID